MKKINWILSAVVVLGITFAATSCENTDDVTTKISQENITFYASLLTMSDNEDIDETTEVSELKSTTLLERCFTVDVETNANNEIWPRKWSINYAAEGCSDFRGNVRKGSIHIDLTDHWKNEYSLRTVEYRNFYFNENKREGTLTIENTGMNEDSLYTFMRKYENGKLHRGDTAQMSWDCNKDVVMAAGYDTWEFADDEYFVNGGANGVDFDGNNFTMQITNQLHYRNGCFYPVSGTLEIETEGYGIATIDYGEGECDNKATLTQNGETTEIDL